MADRTHTHHTEHDDGNKIRCIDRQLGFFSLIPALRIRFSKSARIIGIGKLQRSPKILIASICLTHKNGGLASYGSKNTSPIRDNLLMQSIAEDNLQYVYPDRTGASTSSRYSGMTIGKTELIFLIDRAKDCVYYFKVADKNHIHITKRRAFLKTVSILDNIYTTKPLIEEIELAELSSELQIGYWSYNYDPSNDCLYICTSSNSRTAPEGKFLITEIKVDTWKIKQYEITNTTDKYLRTEGNWGMFVTEGYLLLRGYDAPYDVYKIQITNPANVVKLKRAGM